MSGELDIWLIAYCTVALHPVNLATPKRQNESF